MSEPRWLTDATTIADLLALPEPEQKRWEAMRYDGLRWFGREMWSAWQPYTVVRVRRIKQTVTIDADLARAWVADLGNTWTANTPTSALLSAFTTALAELDGDA